MVYDLDQAPLGQATPMCAFPKTTCELDLNLKKKNFRSLMIFQVPYCTIFFFKYLNVPQEKKKELWRMIIFIFD